MSGMAASPWETGSYPALQQYEAWQDKLQRVYGSWQVDRPAGGAFDARMISHAVGGFQIVDCTCDPCGAVRTRAEVGRDDRESLTIQLVLSGKEAFAVDGDWITLGAGDVLIWNSIRPMKFEVQERLRKISVTMPLARLRSWLPSRWHSIDTRLPHRSPGAGLLSSVIGSLSPAFLAGTLRNSEALTESVMGILVNALDIDRVDEPASLRGAQLLLAKQYIEANLDNPDLSPALVATARRISVRYLHAMFEAEGTTVQQFVIRQRLLRCRRELENPMMAGRTITDIAYAWGFQNATHFSRRFKTEFGLTPQDFRAQATGPQARIPGHPAT